MSIMDKAPESFFQEVANLKIEKILDIIRRVVANPGNAKEAAEQIAQDWCPLVQINKKGKVEFVVGDGKKK